MAVLARRGLIFLVAMVAVWIFVSAQVSSSSRWSLAQWQISATAPRLPPEFSYPSINKFGFNGAIAATEEVVWSGSTTYNYPASALVMTIVSAEVADDGDPGGTGARTVKIYCLDAAGVPFDETLTLNGTAAVSMAAGCWRVYRAVVLTAGSGGVNDGTLTIANGGTTYGEIPADRNQTLTAAYTCPEATRCVIEWVTVASDDNIDFGPYVRPSGEVFRPSFQHQLNAQEAQSWWWGCIPALADIECRATSLSASAEVGCSFRVHHIATPTGTCR